MIDGIDIKCFHCANAYSCDTGSYSEYTPEYNFYGCSKKHWDEVERSEISKEKGVIEIASERCEDYVNGRPEYLGFNPDLDDKI